VTQQWKEDFEDEDGPQFAAETAETTVPGLALWPLAVGFIAGVAAAVVVDRFAPLPPALATTVSWPTWPTWGLALGLLAQLFMEWMSWREIERDMPETVRAVVQTGDPDAALSDPGRQPWLTRATARCLDIRPPINPNKVRAVVDEEAVVYQAAFLETVRRRLWVRLTLALLLLSIGAWAGLYRLRSETNLPRLPEVAGAALLGGVAAMLVVGASVLASAHAERVLQAWREKVLGASDTLPVAGATTPVKQDGVEVSSATTEEETPPVAHDEQAQQDQELKKLLGM
jgi:hypothetical protein